MEIDANTERVSAGQTTQNPDPSGSGTKPPEPAYPCSRRTTCTNRTATEVTDEAAFHPSFFHYISCFYSSSLYADEPHGCIDRCRAPLEHCLHVRRTGR